MTSAVDDHQSPLDQFKTKLFECAASGDVDAMRNLIKGVDVNVKNNRGWTALMFAARNGHESVVKILLENGADKEVINSTGQTALDIALFWNHKKSVTELSSSSLDQKDVALNSVPKFKPVKHFFCHNPLDRAGNKRRDTEWIENIKKDKTTKYIVFSDLRPFMMKNTTSARGVYKICTVSYEDVASFLTSESVVVFLGLESERFDSDKKTAWFTVEIGTLNEQESNSLNPQGEFIEGYRSLMQISDVDASIVGQARSMLTWHDRYRFCPTCGSKTKVEEAGYKTTCISKECRSNNGIHNTNYPRTDPVVIMVIISPDLKKCLMGRGRRHPPKMFSCLAGFMEPGETIEDAVRREAHEESGIKIGHVDYHSCQPWPHPSSLMIGCLAYAVTTEIKVDPEEIEQAHWFDRQEVVQMLTHQHKDGLFVPPDQAIAHQLIRTWVTMTANL